MTVTTIEASRRGGPGRVLRLFPLVVVDNCMPWCLFSGWQCCRINTSSCPALGIFLTALVVNTPREHPRVSLEVCGVDLMHVRRHCRSKLTDEVKECAIFSPLFLQDLLQEVRQLKQKVEELEGEKGQYERKLRGTKVLYRST